MGEHRSIVTKYTEFCVICGSPDIETHHLLSGSDRTKANEDALVLPLCRTHHTGERHLSVHLNPVINTWSKMLAELAWEREYIADNGGSVEASKQAFQKRYGKNYL